MKYLILSLALLFCSFGFAQESVSFTLRNNSLKSIPLKIEGVMNPNLSPKSNSGVSAKIGTRIFFYPKSKLKKELLFVVSEENAGQKIVVDRLIKQRKKELGL